MGMRSLLGRGVRRDKWEEGRNGIILHVNGSQSEVKLTDQILTNADGEDKGWLVVRHYPNGEVTYYNYDHILWIRWYD